MKLKLLRSLLIIMMCIPFAVNAQRYLSEIFTDVQVTSNVQFGQNVLPPYFTQGVLDTFELKADVYEPVGDVAPARATVIMIHTGSFLPIFYNGQPTGAKNDSAVAEICRRFARRGFTAISMDYRYGWNPASTDQEVRTGTILQAAGRGVQDAKACVRYFRNNALTTNDYHIDQNHIILGGVGTGGYIALAYATVQGVADYSIPKFLSSQNNPIYGFTAGVTYFDPAVWGDIDGYGGVYNIGTNTPGVSNQISFVFNMGGCLGDSSWLDAGNVPMVAFHPVNDPFAPYNSGTVLTPNGFSVIDVVGSYWVIKKANQFQNNFQFQYNSWTDVFTTTANLHNDGYDGLYPFVMPNPGPPLYGQAGPWEWWDSTTVYYICQNFLGFTQGRVDTILANALLSNPDMSKAKGMAYIDTVFGYLIPRLFPVITAGIQEQNVSEKNINIYPNPVLTRFTVNVTDINLKPLYIELNDATGRIIKRIEKPKGNSVVFDRKGLPAGTYFVKVNFKEGNVVKKIILQ